MTTIENNLEFYEAYDWREKGEEWADPWGGSDMQWYGSILPRIHAFLPAARIVEIGAGFGRWAPYLATYCDELVLADITEKCVNHISRRYCDQPNIVPLQLNGKSLEGIASKSIDFVFSFHSLVHADRETMRNYLVEIERILTPSGVAFVHHSNAQSYADYTNLCLETLADYRDISVSAETTRQDAINVGLVCSSQELVGWETEQLLDSFSIIARPNSKWGRANNCHKNPHFIEEMARWGELAKLYGQGQTEGCRPFLYNMKK